ncbi:vinculin-like [Balaenoptera musculus]|uniref:Vinculin-like n=1 Tax=Balaenoptera musculus TaxID=9771 RepID=A0A8B8Z0F3_BALMU|nr:vinculin-like [Balaenoptera musculus]
MWGSGNPLDSHSSFKNGEEAINIPTAVQRSEHLEFHQFHPVFFLQHQHSGTPGGSPGCPAWPHTEVDLPLPEDGSVNSGNRITQVTQEMAKEVFLMAQSLRRRGCILTKEQLITSARKIATSGQNFARLIRIMAKNCVDQRCSQELLYMVEQIQTMSCQLRIISSVKASLARSKSSEELLVENAQQLLRAVSKTVRAAEAASLRGLRQPSPDPEELEVAAFCMQWRRKLRRHRLQETSDLDRDELGLRKTSTKGPPTLVALVQEAL